MKVKLIGCQSAMNEIHHLGIPENTDCEFLDFDLHGNPAKLHVRLQEIIDASQDYSLIILTHSRCSNVLVDLVSPRVPLIFPRTHDCIGLLLGSNERHLRMGKENCAVYYFSQGWLDYGRTPYAEYLEYEEKYGPEMAQSLIDMLYGHYRQALLIKTPGMADLERYRRQVREIADFFKWEVVETEGDHSLLLALINGQPGREITCIDPGVRISEDMLLDKIK